MNELVSIIVPIYNVEPYLNRCIESIVTQTYTNLEIILIDDGSPDNCPAICDEWAKRDNRIIVIHKENGGLSDARNAGLNVSKGEYIAFVDSDDWIDTDYISFLLDKMHSGADIVESGTRFCYNDHLEEKKSDFKKLVSSNDALLCLFQNRDISFTVWNKLYKRSVIDDIFFEVGKYNEDNFWTWKVIRNADSVYVANKVLYNYFARDDSIMSSYSLKRVDSVEAFYECYQTLKNDTTFSGLVKNNFISMALFNLQCAYKYLDKNDKTLAINRILRYLKESKIRWYDKEVNGIWNKLFLFCPIRIVKIRILFHRGL